MNIHVFVGPTVPVAECRTVLEATYRPPAAQGDVYEAARSGAEAIAIVDGYFERVPAVWHREILWAMSQGVHVFGCASMGALRAAELHTFGMVGIGAIFEAYRRGDLQDDDEVTIVHGDEESGYRAASEAMVNVRATIGTAVRDGVVSAEAGACVLAAAKSLFYPDRHYTTILRLAAASGAPPADLERLAGWIPMNAVDQKRDDALEMLRHLADFSHTAPGRKVVQFQFQHTDAWEQVRRQIDRRPLDTIPGLRSPQSDAVLDELRLRQPLWADVWRSALVRCLALRVAEADGDHAGMSMPAGAIEAFRHERGLLTESDVERWVAQQGWTFEDLQRLVTVDALVQRVIRIYEADLDRHLADELRLRGVYAELAARARAKHDLLSEHGFDEPSGNGMHISDAELWQWFAAEVVGLQRSPAPVDLAADLGLPSVEALRRLALRELGFVRLQAAQRQTLLDEEID